MSIASTLPETSKITSTMAGMPDAALQQMAQMYKSDPYVLPLIVSESQRRQMLRAHSQAQSTPQEQPKVVDQAIAAMAPQPPMPQMAPQQPMPNAQQMEQQLPENQGIARLPAAQSMEFAAEGGIMGYAEGGGPDISKMSGAELLNLALQMEGVTDPTAVSFVRAIHAQESSGAAKATTSNKGARGPMQVTPIAFRDVADKDMDYNDTLDSVRAGVRYAVKGLYKAGGEPSYAAAFYYGGPQGLSKAMKGEAVTDPDNPDYPNTLEYGASIVQRMKAQGKDQAPKDQIPKDAPRTPVAGTPPSGSNFGAGVADILDTGANMLTGGAKAVGYGTRRFMGDSPSEATQTMESIWGPARNPVAKMTGIEKTAAYQNAPLESAGRVVGQNVVAPAVESVAETTGLDPADVENYAQTLMMAAPGKISPKRALRAVDNVSEAINYKLTGTRPAPAGGIASLDPNNMVPPARARAEAAAAQTNAQKGLAALGPAEKAMAAQATKNSKNMQQALADAQPTEAYKLQTQMREVPAGPNGKRVGAAALMDATPAPKEEPFDDWATAGTYTTDSMPSDKTIIAAAKDTVKATDPDAKTKGLSGEDWLQFGLRLMATKSPHFLQAVGEAGVGALGDRAARGKAEGESAYVKARTAEATANADFTNSLKGISAAEKAFASDPSAKAILKQMENPLFALDPLKMQNLQRDLDAIRARILKSFGVTADAGIAAPSNQFAGFKVMGVK